MKYVFSPVPSRRLDRSLEVDPIPLKTCNWSCVYCQLGRTRLLTNVRREYIPIQDILAEVQQALEILRSDEKAQVVMRHGESFWSAAGLIMLLKFRKREIE